MSGPHCVTYYTIHAQRWPVGAATNTADPRACRVEDREVVQMPSQKEEEGSGLALDEMLLVGLHAVAVLPVAHD